MSEDLQSLLEKINREGVEKARTEADKIIADAKAKAADIVKTANAEAAKAKADAEKAAAIHLSVNAVDAVGFIDFLIYYLNRHIHIAEYSFFNLISDFIPLF